MFTAKMKNGKTVSLLHEKQHEYLKQLSKKETFYCPSCHSIVVIKSGKSRRWHFAHQQNTTCGSSEAESDYHLEGKEKLYEWLAQQRLNVNLEPYISVIKQRPDLYLHSPYATPIEFQCSTISDTIFLERTSAYYKIKTNPIWILGGNRLNRIWKNEFRLSRMDWLAIREPENDFREPFLLYFCPDSDRFAILSNLIPYSSTRFFANLIFLESNKTSYVQLMKNNWPQPFQLTPSAWLQIKTNWRSYSSKQRSPAFHYIRKMLQTLRKDLQLFPPEAGLPTRYQYWLDIPPHIWQTWLLLQLHPFPIGQTVRFQDVYFPFQRMISRKIFTVRQLPLLKKTHYSFAVMDYLLALCELGLLKRIGKSTFVKRKPIVFPKTLNEALLLDQEVFLIFQKDQKV